MVKGGALWGGGGENNPHYYHPCLIIPHQTFPNRRRTLLLNFPGGGGLKIDRARLSQLRSRLIVTENCDAISPLLLLLLFPEEAKVKSGWEDLDEWNHQKFVFFSLAKVWENDARMA